MNASLSNASADELEALVRRIGRAKGADRELDAAIWHAVDLAPDSGSDTAITGSIDAGIKLVRSLLPKWQWKLQLNVRGGTFYKFTLQAPDGIAVRGRHETLPALAVVDGLLRALLEKPAK
jgi:hypothetical protein